MRAKRIALVMIVTVCLFPWNSDAARLDYAIGADVSFMKQAEDGGFKFKDQNEPKPGLEIFRNHGYNWVRLRLFHTPTRLPNDLAYINMTFAESPVVFCIQ
jgi:arabinogalactan endo-1,4-beta-galactosidase